MAEDDLLQDAAAPSVAAAESNAAPRPSDDDDPAPSKCCGCLSPRLAAVLVCMLASSISRNLLHTNLLNWSTNPTGGLPGKPGNQEISIAYSLPPLEAFDITNVLSITICVVLLIDKQLDYYYSNEKFNYVFMITINAIMLMSNFLILRGAWMQQQRYVMAWIFLYVVLVFLENVVGISAFILAMVAHASAWCAVPFVLMIILDVLYVYCILTVHKYCRSLEGYSVFP